jgi:hypothetical protein
MGFTPNIPASGQSLGATRDLIRNNFSTIDTTLAVNHIAMNASGQGKHKFLQMPVQGSAPATAASEIGLYSKDDVGGVARLFFRGESNGIEYQMQGDVTAAASGSVMLFGGIIMKWGTANLTIGSNNVSFSSAFPNNCWSAVVSTSTSTLGVTYTISLDKLVISANSNVTIYYIAIGN